MQNSEKRKHEKSERQEFFEKKPDWCCAVCGKKIRNGHTSIDEVREHLNELCSDG